MKIISMQISIFYIIQIMIPSFYKLSLRNKLKLKMKL